MRGRRRLRLFGLIAGGVVSLSSFGGMIANYWHLMLLSHETAGSYSSVTVGQGAVWVSWARVATPPPHETHLLFPARQGPDDAAFVPYRWRPILVWKPKNRLVVVPLWLFALAGAGAAGWAMRGLSRAKRPGCDGCGYDIRGLTDRCPECGRPLGNQRGSTGAPC